MCALPGNFLFSGLQLMQLFGAPMKLEVSIKGSQGGGFLCATGYYWFVSREVWLGVADSRTFIIAAWKRGGLNVISKYGLGQRLQGLSGVGIVCV